MAGRPLTHEDVVPSLSLFVFTHLLLTYFLCKREQAPGLLSPSQGVPPSMLWGLHLLRDSGESRVSRHFQFVSFLKLDFYLFFYSSQNSIQIRRRTPWRGSSGG